MKVVPSCPNWAHTSKGSSASEKAVPASQRPSPGDILSPEGQHGAQGEELSQRRAEARWGDAQDPSQRFWRAGRKNQSSS